MAINEIEVEQLFRTLGERFATVHAPAFESLWASVRGDMYSAERLLVGEDISELVSRLEDLSRAVNPVSEALTRAGPHLTAHAARVSAAFGESYLSSSGNRGASVAFGPGNALTWGAVLSGVSGGASFVHSLASDLAKLTYLSPFTEDGLKAWDAATQFVTKLPGEIGDPILGVMRSVMSSGTAETLAGFGDSVAKFVPVLGWAAAGLQTGQAIHDIATEGWNTQTVEGLLKAGGSVAAQFGPVGWAVDAGVNLGIFTSNELWSHFPDQTMAVSNFIVGIPGDLGTAGADTVHGVENAWNAASDVVGSGWHDVTGAIGNIHLPWP